MAKHRRSFSKEWELTYFCVEDDDSARCLVCSEKLICKKYNIERHHKSRHANLTTLEGPTRAEKLAELLEERQAVIESASQSIREDRLTPEAAVRTSFKIAHKIAMRGKPFTDGEFVKECMTEAAEILCPTMVPKFASVALSPATIQRRIVELADDVSQQLHAKGKTVVAFSVAVDESTDDTCVAQVAVFVRGVEENLEEFEELLAMVSLDGQTTGEITADAIESALENAGFPLDRMFSLATDGAPSMTGRFAGVVARLRLKVKAAGAATDLIGVHCIIHREALCSKVVRLKSVMDVVTKTINFIRVKGQGLNRREFQTLMKDMEMEHTDLPFYTEVRWLSCGKTLKRFFEMRDEIALFMEMKQFPVDELKDPVWVRNLAFLTDITGHLNDLNVQLQGRGKLIVDLLDLVKAFLLKLDLWKMQLQEHDYSHFNCLKSMSYSDIDDNDMFIHSLQDLISAFNHWFSDAEPLDSLLQIFVAPFAVKPTEVAADLQMEIIDLQCDRQLRERFRLSKDLPSFYKLLPRLRFPKLHLIAARVMCMFGSTFVCEQFYSLMNITKSKYRSAISNENLQASLRLMCAQKIVPNIDRIVSRKRCQVSGGTSSSSSN
ncbi:General transcription factor II-I repeat domain-containing protein 2A [Frankliniella fusca]|uniref:General transcription factor II-I repeat domain-containing protein 2A n=1 Tax=Frankliniella fusca TaxID=407009 RepID=A0AAE1HBK0_9NEOP|nr:General transcription factor II-I repeat domain-containing protein 2A [Frankliniella fusca]